MVMEMKGIFVSGSFRRLRSTVLLLVIPITITTTIIIILTITTVTFPALAPTVPNLNLAALTIGQKATYPDVLLHITAARQELQRHNTTAALIQLDMATQAISTASAKLSLIDHELSVFANLVKAQNRTPTFDLLFSIDHNNNNNTIIPANQSSGMVGEVATYNALANIIVARQELQHGNLQGANEELDIATQAVSEFSRILLSMAAKINTINDEWIASG
jgi:hypothetical protein